jgi:hypothetical protein
VVVVVPLGHPHPLPLPAHTHATLLLEDGETERYVAERLGDTVQMVHETCGHVTPLMRAAAVQRLAARLGAPATVRDRT